MRADEFWWKSITGPQQVVSKVLSAMNVNKMVLLRVPSDLPWRHTMRGQIEQQFRDNADSYDVLIDPIDAQDEVTDEDPGSFLLNRYSANDEEVRVGFRESKNNTIQEYLKKNNVLKNRVIWIKGVSGSQACRWIKFCEKYRIDSISQGCFVLEVHGTVSEMDLRNTVVISYEDYVTNYDVQLFNNVYLNENGRYSIAWKQYIATLAATICDSDAEVSRAFIDIGNLKEDSPTQIIKQLAEDGQYARRGSEEGSQHILSSARNNDEVIINNKIWKAQMQVLFPIIEMERVQLIEKWEYEIQDALQKNKIMQYNEQIYKPYDVELGTLVHYMRKHSADGYMIYIPDKDDRQRIEFLHSCRNLLAHVCCCSTEQVKQLLDK